ncbi:type II toxin-antitoxin system VapC family toxin [bacterium]|nr:type II toxin-antitoxin system VapC family toxin [bacterium]
MTQKHAPSFVLDASVALPWCFEDEVNKYAEAVLDRLDHASAIVPSLWRLETANALVIAERRGRITRAKSMQMAEVLINLPIIDDIESVLKGLESVLDLARDYGLTAYDAAYLELAMRLGLPIATLDKVLTKAAEKAGVQLF